MGTVWTYLKESVSAIIVLFRAIAVAFWSMTYDVAAAVELMSVMFAFVIDFKTSICDLIRVTFYSYYLILLY